MTLTSGTKLGAFEITALLGKGGMVEAYRVEPGGRRLQWLARADETTSCDWGLRTVRIVPADSISSVCGDARHDRRLKEQGT